MNIKKIISEIITEGLVFESTKKTYNMIGFANKYYTLWQVTEDKNHLEYQYIKNLSFDFDVAKQKAGTELFNDKLRGRTKSFIVVRYNNGMEQEFEVDRDGIGGSSVEYALPFGKYSGQSVFDVVNNDPQYLAWMVRNITGNKHTKLVAFINSLLPVQDIFKNDPKYKEETERIKKRKEVFDNETLVAIKKYEEKIMNDYGLSVELFINKKNPKKVFSNVFEFEQTMLSVYVNKSDRFVPNKNKRSVTIQRRLSFKDRHLVGYFKLDPLFDFKVLEIENLNPEDLESTPRLNMSNTVSYYIPNYDVAKEKYTNSNYRISGKLDLFVHDMINGMATPTFIVNKVNLV